MAKIQAPAPAAGDKPEKPAAQIKNLHRPGSDDVVPLQVKIPASLRREVKAYAAEHDVTVSKLLEEMYRFYRQHHG